MSEYAPIFIAVLIVISLFIWASKFGAVKVLASGVATLVGILVFFIGIHFFPAFAESALESYTSKTVLGLAAAVALIAYVITRLLSGWIFKLVLGPDSWLHAFAEGFLGGVLSLFTSVVMIFFLFLCIRISGTVMELNYVASLSRDRIVDETEIPPYPAAAIWRNTIEDLPILPALFDAVDPFSSRAHRNAAALLMVSRSTPIHTYFLGQPETAELAALESISSLSLEPKILRALESQKRIDLLLNPTLQERVDDSSFRGELASLKLQPILEGFVASIPQPLVAPPPGGITL
ncbi:MAG: hypothetical protein AAGC68_01515 [Verrucomicrobiota bacterium]